MIHRKSLRSLTVLAALSLLGGVIAPASAHTKIFGATHSLTITGDTDGSTFKGRVASAVAACERARTIKIRRVIGGIATPDALVATVTTTTLGRWSKTFGSRAAGNYYAVALRKVIQSPGHRHVCQPARSANKALSAPVVEPNAVDWCILYFPTSMTVPAGQGGDLVYGRVMEAGVTDAAGAPPDTVIAELGVGPDATEPASNGTWTWGTATWNAAYTEGSPGYVAGTDEFQASFTAPVTPDTYDYAYRFSVDDGVSFTYCDAGSAGSTDGYATSDAGHLTVTP